MPSDLLDLVPDEARDPLLPGVVHWLEDPATADDFFEGAYWAFSYAYERFFGDVLGPALLDYATDVEEYSAAGGWQPV